MTTLGLTVGQSCPEPGGIPIDEDEDVEEDDVERLVEVDPTLVDDFELAHQEYNEVRLRYEELKARRERLRLELEKVLKDKTGTATVGGTRRLRYRVLQQTRVDTKRLRSEAPDIARMYEKTVGIKRVDVLSEERWTG